jgi:predicted  nucleic acid-binding Zn-ribbon protein
MSHLLLIALLLLADDSPLVKAAKANGGLKKPIVKKTITNGDVKKSTGKITELPKNAAAAAAPASVSAPEAGAPTLATFEAHKKSVASAAKRVADAESGVADLEKDLARIEQSYYEAEDLNDRDTKITARFDQTKKQLDAARKELADARDAVAALTPKPRYPETPPPQ